MREIKVVKNFVELRAIRIRKLVKNSVKLGADILRLFLNNRPSAILRHLKAVVVISASDSFVFILIHHAFILFVPYVANTFIKEKTENIFLVIRAINLAAENVSALPEKLLKLWQGKLTAHLVHDGLNILRAIFAVTALTGSQKHQNNPLFPLPAGIRVDI